MGHPQFLKQGKRLTQQILDTLGTSLTCAGYLSHPFGNRQLKGQISKLYSLFLYKIRLHLGTDTLSSQHTTDEVYNAKSDVRTAV
jgi:hypothetical protein